MLVRIGLIPYDLMLGSRRYAPIVLSPLTGNGLSYFQVTDILLGQRETPSFLSRNLNLHLKESPQMCDHNYQEIAENTTDKEFFSNLYYSCQN